jgi:hypothetical protein
MPILDFGFVFKPKVDVRLNLTSVSFYVVRVFGLALSFYFLDFMNARFQYMKYSKYINLTESKSCELTSRTPKTVEPFHHRPFLAKLPGSYRY